MTGTPHPDVRLEPNEHGYVAVESLGGSIGCLIQRDWVGCETPASEWPPRADGTPYHSFRGKPDGSIEWADGQMGDMSRITVYDGVYHALGWTIVPIDDGLQLTNDQTGHSICVTTAAVRGV